MLKPVEKIDGFPRFFMCGFLDALDLSPVPLYGDDRLITPSASKPISPCFTIIKKVRFCTTYMQKDGKIKRFSRLFMCF